MRNEDDLSELQCELDGLEREVNVLKNAMFQKQPRVGQDVTDEVIELGKKWLKVMSRLTKVKQTMMNRRHAT